MSKSLSAIGGTVSPIAHSLLPLALNPERDRINGKHGMKRKFAASSGSIRESYCSYRVETYSKLLRQQKTYEMVQAILEGVDDSRNGC